MRGLTVLVILTAACSQDNETPNVPREREPQGIKDIGATARRLFRALKDGSLQTFDVLRPTRRDVSWARAQALPEYVIRALADATENLDEHFARESADSWFRWDQARYRGYTFDGDVLLLFVTAGGTHHDFRAWAVRVKRGWVLADPLYCAGRLRQLPASLRDS